MTTPAIPTTEPFDLPAGDTWTWTKSLGDYPADAWTLTYELLSQETTANNITITASADGTDHLVSVAPGTTVGYAAGTYAYRAYATNDSDGRRFTVKTGHFRILPDFATSTADPRSQVKRTLDAINALLEGKAGSDKLNFKMPNGLELTKMTPGQLLSWRDAYKRLYQEELAAENGNGDTEITYVEFESP